MTVFKTISFPTCISIPKETQHQSRFFVISQQQVALGCHSNKGEGHVLKRLFESGEWVCFESVPSD